MDAAGDLLQQALNHCLVVIDRDSDILLALAAAGLAGGGGHCVGMCGPFVLTQTAARLEQIPVSRMTEWTRLSGALLVPYHLGRAVSYAAIGAAAALVAGHVGALPGLRRLSSGLLLLAAFFFLSYGLRGVSFLRLPAWLTAAPSAPASGCGKQVGRLGRLLQPLFGAPVGMRGFALGLLLGFIPCGLVYGAVAAAAAAGDPLTGALGLLAFAAGTFPALLAVGLVGHLAGRAWREAVAYAAPMLMVINAGVLGFLAVRGLTA
jgi:uncharacterized protein